MNQPPIFRHMLSVADAARCRILRILAQHELTVSELCAVMRLPQSTVSRHLKLLLDDGWISSRPQATSRFYSMTPGDLPTDARGLWSMVQDQIAGTPEAREDDSRIKEVLAARRSQSLEFFSSRAHWTSEQWDRFRGDLFGHTFHLTALLGLCDERWTVADLGCGTGPVTESLAHFVARVIGVDASAAMLATSRQRVAGLENVELRQGQLEALPIDDGVIDAALLMLVLHFIPDPALVLAEAARVLRPGGKLLIVDMTPHGREEYQTQMGHVWPGFSEEQLGRYFESAGLEGCRWRLLPPEPGARGPRLFVAVARRAAGASAPYSGQQGRAAEAANEFITLHS